MLIRFLLPAIYHTAFIYLGVIKLRDLLSFSPIDILIKSADQKSYHAILQELKDKEVYNMIIDIHDTDMSDFLRAVSLIYFIEKINVQNQKPLKTSLPRLQVLDLQMNDFKYHYLFTSFDLETFEMEDFRYNFVNITAFRLVDTGDVHVKDRLKEMEQFSKQNNMKFKKNLAVEVKVLKFKVLTTLSCYVTRSAFHLLYL